MQRRMIQGRELSFKCCDISMHRPRLSKSISTANATSITTATSVTASGVSQPELAAGQRQQGSFAGMPTNVHIPKSTHISAAEQPFTGLRLLAEVSASQVDPFAALATHQSVTFDEAGQYQEQPDDYFSLSNESSQPVEDTPNKTTTNIPKQETLPSVNEHFRRALSGTVPETLLTAITGDPRLLTGHCIMGKEPDPTDKWIIWTGDKEWPFKCGYEGCDRHYTKKQALRSHFFKHTGDSRFRCHLGECTGKIRYCNQNNLIRHVQSKHSLEKRFRCDLCERRFGRKDCLKSHRQIMHSIEEKRSSQKRKRK